MMKKIRIAALLLLFSFFGFGQELPKEKSENHIQIQGMNIFMVPPPSFEPSSNFKGLQNPNDQTSMIMAIEIPGPYSEVIKGFNSEMMQKQGMELKTQKEIKIAEFEGLFLELDQFANGMTFSKYILNIRKFA